MPEPEFPEPGREEKENDLLSDWLRRTAAAMPDAPAIVEQDAAGEDRVTSFRELFEQAASLALRFVEHGIQKQDRIALVLPKSTDAIISVFASLLAGAVYVPIHPQWPKERIETTLADCAARLVIDGDSSPPRITDRETDASIAWPAPDIRPGISGEHWLPRADAGEPAFILFTSGSTGQPKGVVLSHRAVSAFVKWSAREFQICSADRIACPSPLSFDLSTFDIFNMALCGATCVLVPGHSVWMPRFLVQFVREARITCWYSVPSILAGMLEEGRMAQHDYPGLRVVLFAGEVFRGADVARLQAAVPQAVCANLYGPTETNVVTWYRVPRGFDGSEPLPIGQPCPYATVTVDAASGELLAGGESVMSRYWNRPEDTERAFVNVEGKRHYRTGDRVSRAADGNYLFLGRFDRQVKRRGFRIELGEIETALAGCEDILEAAVVAVDDSKMGTAIIAFVRARSAGPVGLIEAKAHCARTLPRYMVPDRIVFLDTIPKGNRGKIDYIALSKVAETLDQAAPIQAASNQSVSNQAASNQASTNQASTNHAPNHGDQDRSPAVHR
ncbi:MAG: amino acid adenylation domain-containing protein [Candidatus Sulfotelmatobacter sp.]